MFAGLQSEPTKEIRSSSALAAQISVLFLLPEQD
jgi:hypothetical protein